MKKTTNIILILTAVNWTYLLFIFGFNPYMTIPFLSARLSFNLPVVYIPFSLSLVSFSLFLFILFRDKVRDWFYFFIISLNLFAYIVANYYYAEASDWLF